MISGPWWGLGESHSGCADRRENSRAGDACEDPRPLQGGTRAGLSAWGPAFQALSWGIWGWDAVLGCGRGPWLSLGFGSLLWEVLSALGQGEPAGWG